MNPRLTRALGVLVALVVTAGAGACSDRDQEVSAPDARSSASPGATVQSHVARSEVWSSLGQLVPLVDLVVVATVSGDGELHATCDDCPGQTDTPVRVADVLKGDHGLVDDELVVRQHGSREATIDVGEGETVAAVQGELPLLEAGKRVALFLKLGTADEPPFVWEYFEIESDGAVVNAAIEPSLPAHERRFATLDAFRKTLSAT